MNPLTDELGPDAKAWLAAKFAELRVRFQPVPLAVPQAKPWTRNRHQFWER